MDTTKLIQIEEFFRVSVNAKEFAGMLDEVLSRFVQYLLTDESLTGPHVDEASAIFWIQQLSGILKKPE